MFSPGERVVCVDDSPNENGDSPLVVKGAVYTVRASYGGGYGVTLHELDCPSQYVGFRASRFRRIEEKKTDISVFTKMLKSEPVDA